MKITAVTELFLPKDSRVWMNKSEACLSVSHASLFFDQETPSVWATRGAAEHRAACFSHPQPCLGVVRRALGQLTALTEYLNNSQTSRS